MLKQKIILTLLLSLLSFKVFAHDSTIPDGLNFTTRENKIKRLEIEPFVGEYLGNYLNNSYVLGMRVGYRLNGPITLGLEFNYSRMQFDDNSQFGLSVTNRNEYIGQATFTYAFPVLQRVGKGITEADLTTTVGVGAVHLNEKTRFAGSIGGGLKIYTSIPWFAFRFDVMTYMYSLPRLNDSKFADDWIFSAGPTFLLF